MLSLAGQRQEQRPKATRHGRRKKKEMLAANILHRVDDISPLFRTLYLWQEGILIECSNPIFSLLRFALFHRTRTSFFIGMCPPFGFDSHSIFPRHFHDRSKAGQQEEFYPRQIPSLCQDWPAKHTFATLNWPRSMYWPRIVYSSRLVGGQAKNRRPWNDSLMQFNQISFLRSRADRN